MTNSFEKISNDSEEKLWRNAVVSFSKRKSAVHEDSVINYKYVIKTLKTNPIARIGFGRENLHR